MIYQKVLATLVVGFFVGFCGCSVDDSSSSELKFDAPHSIALEGRIDKGVIYTTSTDHGTIRAEAREQLKYMVGQFNGWSGVPDLNRLTGDISDVTPVGNGLYKATYYATIFVSWSKNYQVPSRFTLILPARGDYEGRKQFYRSYGADSSKRCLSNGAHDMSAGIHWYYYRPQKNTCPLYQYQSNNTVYFPVNFSVSSENTQGKYPEYHKVWEDGRLVVTAIYSKETSGSQSSGDSGVSSYRELYTRFNNYFGRPKTTTLPYGAEPGLDHPDVQAVFRSNRGDIDLQIFLVDTLTGASSGFKAKYNERTKISDFISYNGHSGLGANIRALAQMGEFVPDQYQIFFVNGCDTFAYVDNSLRDAHLAQNPDESPYKYFDLITNAMPSYFNQNSYSNMVIIDALVKANSTYRSILRNIDSNQRVNVSGEQDNSNYRVF